MDKTVSFGKGIRRQPSIGEDGELSELVNLVPKNGELVNVKPMGEIGITLEEESKLICVHKVDTGTNYIVLEQGKSLFGYNENGEIYEITDKVLCDGENLSIVPVGNVLAISALDGIKYAIWKDGDYVWLGSLPQLSVRPYLTTERLSVYELNQMFETDINVTTSRVISGEEGEINADLLKQLKESPSGNSVKLYGETRQKVYEKVFAILNQYTNQLTKKGYFLSPFYVAFAYRFYDGTHISGSEPILLTPNTWGKPIVEVDIDDNGVATVNPTFLASKLCADITLPHGFHKWKDLVVGIDVFVSEQITDYTDSPESITQIEVAPYWKYGESETWTYLTESEPKMMHESMWRGLRYAKSSNDKSYIANAVSYKKDTTYAFQRDGVYDERYLAIDNSAGHVKILDMNTKSNKELSTSSISASSLGLSANYDIYDLSYLNEYANRTAKLRFTSDATGYIVRGPYLSESYEPSHFQLKLERVGGYSYSELIRNAADFRRIAWYNFEDYGHVFSEESYASNKLEGEIPLIEGSILNRSSQESMADSSINYQIQYRGGFGYNNRLNLIVDNVFYNQCQQLSYQNPCERTESISILRSAYITLYENGQYAYVEIDTGDVNLADLLYLSYPSRNAISLTAYGTKNGTQYKYTFQLSQHKVLDVAYAFNDYDILPYKAVESNEVDKPTNKYISYGNKIDISNVSNPFAIDKTQGNMISTQKIYAITSSAKALSQGQFGQFPLYAFCTDGIWALEVASDGSYSARQPISRDVCNNPKSITQIDGAVVFTTDQGLKMIQGSDVVLLSGNMDGHNVDESLYFPADFFKSKGESYTAYDNLVVKATDDFRVILKYCRIAYDYPNNMLRIFPSEGSKYYVYDLGTREFGSAIGEAVSEVVADYPTSLVQIGQKIYTFTNEANNTDLRDGLLLTRPIDMGEPFALKKLQDMRMHYTKYAEGSKCSMVVYVSNDGVTWFVLPSLRKCSFKYYRIAIITHLSDDDRLSGLIMRYEVERTNKLR